MAVHDWTRVGDAAFHDFHGAWITHLKEALNGGVLPAGYFARQDQYVSRQAVPDVVTLEAWPQDTPETGGADDGGVAVADAVTTLTAAPPVAQVRKVLTPTRHPRARRVTVRREKDGQVVAVIEVVSAANKDRRESVTEFAGKAADLLRAGVHVLVLDLLPPTRHTPGGMHPAVVARLGGRTTADERQPADRPVGLLAYRADRPQVEAFLDFLRVGDPLPPRPLFLTPQQYVNVPLAATYDQAFRGVGGPDRTALTAAGGS